MRTLPADWKSAVRREMTPSWVGWVLIAALGGLVVAGWRGDGAELFYPLQSAVANKVSANACTNLTLWLVMCVLAGGYIVFGPIIALIAAGTAAWSRAAPRWTVWALILWSLWIIPANTIASRWWRQQFHESANLYPVFVFIGWVGFIVLAWFMTRSRWVIAGLLTLWLLQRNAFWFEPIALRSILWHAGLFAVFFGWALRKRMGAVPVSAAIERPVRVSSSDAVMDEPRARLA